jgi:DNA-binding PadR family transcriptional regulator
VIPADAGEAWERCRTGVSRSTLSRLERKGLLSSEVGEGSAVRAGRPRRYYRLQPQGRRALVEARLAVTHLWRGFRLPLKGRV